MAHRSPAGIRTMVNHGVDAFLLRKQTVWRLKDSAFTKGGFYTTPATLEILHFISTKTTLKWRSMTMKYTRDDIVSILEGYQELRREALQLEFELEHFQVTGEDIIDTMNFNSQLGEYVSGGQRSDKTAAISELYKEKADSINIRHHQEISRALAGVKLKMDRLEYYISILGGKYSDVLHGLYIEGLIFSDVAAKLKMSSATVPRIRNKGIDKLREMYNRLAEINTERK